MEKAPLLPRTEEPARRRPSPTWFRRYHSIVFAAILVLFWLGPSFFCSHKGRKVEAERKVPLEVHIMSKCPDARDCLQKLVVPTMANVSDKIDFRLSFIGKATEEDDGVQCKHGQTECLGNIVELCAASEYPDPKIYLGFTMCLERDYKKLPEKELLQDCALEHGIDFDKLNDCMSKDDGSYGMGLLRDSVTRSAGLNIQTSCTIRLDGKSRCIYDNGGWRDCSGGHEPVDLIHDVNELYD